MDLRLPPEAEETRRRIRAWLDASLPGYAPADRNADSEWSTEFTQQLARDGWLCPAWPKEFGGAGVTLLEQFVIAEELWYARAPQRAHHIGVEYVGPSLMVYGSREQRARFLPAIATGGAAFCLGHSEPDAGSDLANMKTAATPVEGGYRVSGLKIWCSRANRAEYIYFGARTDPAAPKHKGISYFIAPMSTPGITVRPLTNLLGETTFCEVAFEDAFVPAEGLVGEENRGWYQNTMTLDIQRAGRTAMFAALRRDLDDLMAFAREVGRGGLRTTVRHGLAELRTRSEVGRMLALKVISMLQAGQVPTHESAMLKLFWSELEQAIARCGMALIGLYGQLAGESRWAPLRGSIERRYLATICATISGGTSEIQRNVIAMRGLGLPKG